MRYLVEFSGGMDCTAALLKALETDKFGTYDLMHVQFRGAYGTKWIAQLAATISLIELFKKDYPKARFNLSIQVIFLTAAMTVIDYRYYTKMLAAQYAVAYGRNNVARSAVSANIKYAAMINGSTLDDAEKRGTTWPERGPFIDKDGNMTFEQRSCFDLLSQYRLDHIHPWRPIVNYTKKEAWDTILTDEYRKLVWTCLIPQIDGAECTPCGKCLKCLESTDRGIPLNSIDISKVIKTYELCKAQTDEMLSIVGEYNDGYYL